MTPSEQDAREFGFLFQIGNFVTPPVRMRVRRERGTGLRLVYVGWMTRTKGIFELSEAVVGLQGVTLDLYGPVVRQTELADWHAFVERLNGGGSIRYRGTLDDDEVLEKLPDYDALVVASYSESFGMAAAEAMISKVPLISSRTGFLRALPDDCFTVVPSGSASGIRSILVDLSGRSDVLTQKAEAAFSFASSEFSEEATFPKWIAVYRQIARHTAWEPHPSSVGATSVR